MIFELFWRYSNQIIKLYLPAINRLFILYLRVFNLEREHYLNILIENSFAE